MKKNLLILAILFTCQLHAADYYWVGGGGNWSDLNHWRLGSSGGSIPSIVPGPTDNVFFDAGSSFGTTTPTKTVTLDANGFCNNMTWGNVPNSPRFVTTSATFTVQLQGNLILSPTTTYQLIFAFKGATAATIETKGTVLGEFGMEIDKPGSSLTVTDSLIVPSNINVPTSYITLTAGTFNISGKKLSHFRFISDNTNVRTLEMTNADVTLTYQYECKGANKTINAAGSTLNALIYYRADGGTYNKVVASAGSGTTHIIIDNTTFASLIFTWPGSLSYAAIGNGNTVTDSLVFFGRGNINANNTVGRIRFGNLGTVFGTGNVIRTIECQGNFAIAGNYTNTVDSMLLASNHTTQFWGTFNINKYLYVAGAPCEAFTEINGEPTVGTINFAAGAVVDINNVILTGVNATGPITPIAVNGIDGDGNTGFTITEPSAAGTTLYWVGGAGDWNNRAHWSTTSGGAGGACVPFTSDNVVFDTNSGLTGGGTVTTSSSSFCKDMTWVAGVGTVTFNESATGAFRAYGSVVLQPTVTLNAIIEFRGSSVATLTMNGGGAGTVQFTVWKTGSGSVTLLDNWSNPFNGSIGLTSGSLNMAGRTLNFYNFNSSNSLTRNLDISNATITTNARWIYQGPNKSISSAGSQLTSDWFFWVNGPGSNYPKVDLLYSGTDVTIYSIGNTTFGQLTFTSPSATSIARIVSGNTIRRLEYKGAAYTGGGNTIDSLILAGSRNYLFDGTNTITKYFKAEAITCSGLTEMRGYPATGTLAFAGAAELHIANVYMQKMTATGPLTPITFNGADAGGNAGWTINSAAGAPRYWIGGSGDWNDQSHWSATSGGTGGACVPTVYDDVYFNAASNFTAGNKTVTVNNGNAYCRNIDWTGATNAPIWSKAATWNIEVWGTSVILNPAATFNTSPITLKGATATSLQGSVLGNFDVTIDKPGGSLTLLNNYSNTQTDFVLTAGTFNAAGRTLSISSIDNSALDNVSAIDISNASVTASYLWRYTGNAASHTLNATNSTITTPAFHATGLIYNLVNVTGTLNTSAIINSTTIDSLNFTNTNTASAAGINGTSNILNIVDYKGGGGIYGTGNSIDTLIFFPGNTYTLTAGTNTTINGQWYGSGTPCRATEIISSSASVNATITKNSGDVDFDYVRLRRITAAGTAAPFVARSHSTNLGNNVNWNIAPYNGAAPIYGLGPDSAVVLTNFPITLHTDGFFGAPGSQYTWNNGSTADTLLVTGPGTYSVTVSFPDGCSIKDTIIVTIRSILPVTLASFTGNRVDCQSHLEWKMTGAINFSRFVVEKSNDASAYSKVADIPYTGADTYTWTDPATDFQTSYYRLKMVDKDEKFTYSNTISIKSNCQDQTVKVYPTVTDRSVQVTLPSGYERAAIQVYNIAGQRMSPVITGTGSTRIVQLQDFPKAVYVLQVINGTERKSFKIIKH